MAETFTVEILEIKWEIVIQNQSPVNVEVFVGESELPSVILEDPIVTVFSEPAEIIVVSIAEQGLPGTIGSDGEQGIQGEPAEDAYFLERVTLIVTNPSNTNQTLPNVPRAGSLKLFLNGIMERTTAYSLVGNIVNFSPLNLDVNDEIIFDYMHL